LYEIDAIGGLHPLIVIPYSQGKCVEGYLAISPGLGGFKATNVFITSDANIWQWDSQTGLLNLFATLPSPHLARGITFDHVGTFGFRLIITTKDGLVYVISPWGIVGAPFATVPVQGMLEGPVVAPVAFGRSPNMVSPPRLRM
jgi:hypothetical protein